jgi:hypothetical protein
VTVTEAPPIGSVRPLALLVALGLGSGIAARAAEASPWMWAADLASYPAVWVLAVAVIGRLAPSGRSAAVRAAVFFVAMSAAYVAEAAERLDSGGAWRALVTGLVVSTVAVPAAAVGAWWAGRRPGAAPGALLAFLAAFVLVGGEAWRQAEIWTGAQPYLVGRPVQAAADLGVALVLLLVLPRYRSTRLWGLVVTVPLCWLLWLSDALPHVP